MRESRPLDKLAIVFVMIDSYVAGINNLTVLLRPYL